MLGKLLPSVSSRLLSGSISNFASSSIGRWVSHQECACVLVCFQIVIRNYHERQPCAEQRSGAWTTQFCMLVKALLTSSVTCGRCVVNLAHQNPKDLQQPAFPVLGEHSFESSTLSFMNHPLQAAGLCKSLPLNAVLPAATRLALLVGICARSVTGSVG